MKHLKLFEKYDISNENNVNESIFSFLNKRPKEDDDLLENIFARISKEKPKVKFVKKGINISDVNEVTIEDSKIQVKSHNDYWVVVDGVYLNGSKSLRKKLVNLVSKLRVEQFKAERDETKEKINKKFK